MNMNMVLFPNELEVNIHLIISLISIFNLMRYLSQTKI